MSPFETLVKKVRATTSLFNPQFTMQEFADGLQDAMRRVEILEARTDKLEAKDTKP